MKEGSVKNPNIISNLLCIYISENFTQKLKKSNCGSKAFIYFPLK